MKKEKSSTSRLKILEKSLPGDKNIKEYHQYKADLDEIYNNITEGVKNRSKCQWYEESKKSTKYFLNLKEKYVFKYLVLIYAFCYIFSLIKKRL